MRKIREVLRLKYECNRSNRDIGHSCGIGSSTVSDYLQRAKMAGLDWPLPDQLDDTSLEQQLFPPTIPRNSSRFIRDFQEVHKELQSRRKVTLNLLWQEYKEQHPDGYQYSWFCHSYRDWAARLDVVMRHEHRAGEKLFVDYAGQTVDIVDTAPHIGSVQILYNTVSKMIIFVPVLLKDIFDQGRDYSWERPPCCPRCNYHKVWSHGFVSRHFDGFDTSLLIKCYRCPHCGCVVTPRPDTHFSRFQASKNTICSSIEERVKSGRWPPGYPSSSRRRHWLGNLKCKIQALLSHKWDGGVLGAYDYLISIGQPPVSSSI